MSRSDILKFLREPAEFCAEFGPVHTKVWMDALTWAQETISEHGGHRLRDAQVAAWEGLAHARAALILGPPGTGKTFALSWMALAFIQARRASGLPARVLLTAFTRNAIGNLLEAIAKRSSESGTELGLGFIGTPLSTGPGTGVDDFGDAGGDGVQDALAADHGCFGATTWTLQKLVKSAQGRTSTELTAPIFDLVCIDEASQMALGQGLLALSGLKPDGCVIVAGDNKQLQPISGIHGLSFEGRELGKSLYDYLSALRVPEFAFDETFRLNRPLVQFPEERFYPHRYRSAVPDASLELVDQWKQGLEPWEEVALSPEYPVCILLHEGPPCGTSSPFETHLTARLVRRFRERMVAPAGKSTDASFWDERLAVVSPHRAQNSSIRNALKAQGLGDECVVETVDRIQGKERDAIIASYTVSDPEFALTESEFLFSQERLNVTITRAKTKLVLLVSRRLLEVIPPDEKVFAAAQVLRDFVLSSEEIAQGEIQDGAGFAYPVVVRVRRFDATVALPRLDRLETPRQQDPTPERTPTLMALLAAIRKLAAASAFKSATLSDIRKEILRTPTFSEVRALAQLGAISIQIRKGPHNRPFWVFQPLEPERAPFRVDLATVRERIDEAIDGARRVANLPPFYTSVSQRFDWAREDFEDALKPVVETLNRVA